MSLNPNHPDWNIPSKRRKNLLENIEYPDFDNTAVMTIVSGAYQWYIPLFAKYACAAYPDSDIVIYVRGKCSVPDDLWGEAEVIEIFNDGLTSDGYTTAAMRYLFCDDAMMGYEFILITDIDVMHFKEDPDMWHQRYVMLKEYNLECYGNLPSRNDRHVQFPGIHMVTRDWWSRTKKSREQELKDLKTNKPQKDYDEIMIGQIIKNSGLNIADSLNAGIDHGEHFGRVRNRVNMSRPVEPQTAKHQLFVKDMLNDEEFIELALIASRHIPELPIMLKTYKESLR